MVRYTQVNQAMSKRTIGSEDDNSAVPVDSFLASRIRKYPEINQMHEAKKYFLVVRDGVSIADIGFKF